MKKLFIIILFLLPYQTIFGQIKYTGNIGNHSIELYTYLYSDGVGKGVYMYTAQDEPISLEAELVNDALYLYRVTAQKDTTEIIKVPQYDKSSSFLTGRWTSTSSDTSLSIELHRLFEISYGEDAEWEHREILQQESLPDYYIKTINTKKKGDFYSFVSGVKIIRKKTGQVLQEITGVHFVERLISGVYVGDYNFDGIKDFAVFEQFYAGPNTSSRYYLYNPDEDHFFDSGFEGTSLQFDQKRERVYSRNQCCGGRSISTASYRIINNKMVLVEEHCIKWDEKKQERTERPVEECQ